MHDAYLSEHISNTAHVPLSNELVEGFRLVELEVE